MALIAKQNTETSYLWMSPFSTSKGFIVEQENLRFCKTQLMLFAGWEHTLGAGRTSWGGQSASQAGVLLFGFLCSTRRVNFCIICRSQRTEFKFPLEQGQNDKSDMKEGLFRRLSLNNLGFSSKKCLRVLVMGYRFYFLEVTVSVPI